MKKHLLPIGIVCAALVASAISVAASSHTRSGIPGTVTVASGAATGVDETGPANQAGDEGQQGESGQQNQTGDQGQKGESGQQNQAGDQGQKGESGEANQSGEQK